ncbi:uncharacterized protein BYT42DRAFT_594778 [Radiomyces spectabilis]|uniref:uncharacterized protein n=1 Tax=Radiomyces spectabilis TaxID=64574 RepID=UPI002220A64D|nr:uncharacterized protein BYT42DRAFT_594778 [Radiomyces spectabilis]KAI8372875.1 hypothetical protein BYT42DRAFT_594778 [Radiomyces spectabilis]
MKRQESHEQFKLRLLCRNRQGLDKLKEMGAEIKEVNYENENEIREVFHNVKLCMIIPEFSHKRVQEGENVIKACKQQNVEYVGMFSLIGVDRCQEQGTGEWKHMKQYRQLEQKIEEQFKEKHWIVRHPVYTQIFYYLAPMVEGQNVLPLPVKKNAKWGCIDLHDVVGAMVQLSKRHDKSSIFSGERKLWQFTPKQNFSSEELCRQMAQGLGRDEMQYRETKPNETKEYLTKMREDKRFKERPQQHELAGESDKPYTFPLGKYLNEVCIETIIEWWQLANENKVDITTNDLQEALQRQPTEVLEFFKNNRDNFRRLR